MNNDLVKCRCATPISVFSGKVIPGDILCCWGNPAFADQVIVAASDGKWYHAAMVLLGVSPLVNDLYVGEMWQGDIPGFPRGGGRKLPLNQWLSQRSDQIDVFCLGQHLFGLKKACEWFEANCINHPYHWPTIARFAVQKVQLVPSQVFGPCFDENAPLPDGFVCSTGVHAAIKTAGYHICHNLWTGDVKPARLANDLLAGGCFVGTLQGQAKQDTSNQQSVM